VCGNVCEYLAVFAALTVCTFVASNVNKKAPLLMVNSVNTITIQCDVSGAGNPLCRVMFMLFNAINAFNTCKPHQRSAHSLGVVQHRFGFGLDLGFVILDLVLLLLLISSFHTIRIGQLCRNSIVDEFYLQDIKLMLY